MRATCPPRWNSSLPGVLSSGPTQHTDLRWEGSYLLPDTGFHHGDVCLIPGVSCVPACVVEQEPAGLCHPLPTNNTFERLGSIQSCVSVLVIPLHAPGFPALASAKTSAQEGGPWEVRPPVLAGLSCSLPEPVLRGAGKQQHLTTNRLSADFNTGASF